MTLSLKLFKIFYYIKQIDSKLPCVCSAIDHIGCQNAVRTSVTHSTAPRVPLFCSYHILTSSVIYSSRRKYIFSSVLCLKNFHFATLWQSAVLGSFKCQSVLASPKISRKKCFGWNAIYRNEFGDFSSVFGSIWHVDYVCYMNKAGIQMYVTLNPGVYLIHTYYSTLHKEKKKWRQ